MIHRITGNPKECVYCKSSNFIHERTHGNSHILGDTREVLINKNFFCNECKKYFSTQDEIVVTADLETSCKHPLPCAYCTGENFEDTSQETSHANAKALVLLKEENADLFNFLYNNDESGIFQLEKQLNIATERYFRIRNSGTYPPSL